MVAGPLKIGLQTRRVPRLQGRAARAGELTGALKRVRAVLPDSVGCNLLSGRCQRANVGDIHAVTAIGKKCRELHKHLVGRAGLEPATNGL